MTLTNTTIWYSIIVTFKHSLNILSFIIEQASCLHYLNEKLCVLLKCAWNVNVEDVEWCVHFVHLFFFYLVSVLCQTFFFSFYCTVEHVTQSLLPKPIISVTAVKLILQKTLSYLHLMKNTGWTQLCRKRLVLLSDGINPPAYYPHTDTHTHTPVYNRHLSLQTQTHERFWKSFWFVFELDYSVVFCRQLCSMLT